MPFAHDVVVLGGCGRVGLPLALAFADRGLRVAIYDIDETALAGLATKGLPFQEDGAQTVLERTWSRNLIATSDPRIIGEAEHIVVVIGTPVDEHLNPDPQAVPRAIERVADNLVDGQMLILRSTHYPGVTALVEQLALRLGKRIDVAFCPERIAEGKAMTELFELPQIVSGRTLESRQRAEKLFSNLTHSIVHLQPEEAELAKLFTNTWRYIKFATANQLYMIANDFGLDFERIRSAMAEDYPRAADLPSAGFSAGPCLLKDTLQLAAFNNNNFTLGHSAMMINEGLPLYVIARVERQFDLSSMVVGLLGMAFKQESDDIRSSLSYKLKRILAVRSQKVLCSDPYVTTDESLVDEERVLEEADLLIIGAPHSRYANLFTSTPVIDIWGIRSAGVRV
jgi:UDP-N-acetyl-D-mannosaminuronic acid dehydrogenase